MGKEWIEIDRRFRKSVSLQLDLQDAGRRNSYIPTHSSVMVLKRYLASILGKSKEHATILIGPYGKGKSHLLLVLLGILQGKWEDMEPVLTKIEKVDAQAGAWIRKIQKEQMKYLPVLVSRVSGSLNKSLLYALKEALEREGLGQIVPPSDYSEAANMLVRWQQEYPDTYQKLEEILSGQGQTPQMLKRRLDKMDEAAMEFFRECYPTLTSGSRFYPMVQSDAFRVYQEINRELKEQFGYDGIFVVFDEFSKYLEGHTEKGFPNDMKVLQDMCELADCGGEEKLYVALVAHKSIHAYEKGIPKTVKDAFRGVEGRLQEVPFLMAARNHYELIADTLQKKEPGFSEVFSACQVQGEYGRTLEESFKLPCFFKLFAGYPQYEAIMGKGCFPLLPLCAYLLLHISEKVAQNERTLFTFLASGEQGSLPWILSGAGRIPIGADAVYDYFKGLFRESGDLPNIHKEWLKAEYAMRQVNDGSQKKVLKAMALIRMAHREDELPVQDASIQLALGMGESAYQEAMGGLMRQGVVIFRRSLGVYAFKNNIGVDIEGKITAEIARLPTPFPICNYIRQVSDLDYILPKQHNQEKNMTRFFRYEFLMAEEFLQMGTAKYILEEPFADGKILALISLGQVSLESIREKTESLKESRIVVLFPLLDFEGEACLKRLAAIRSLKGQPNFMEQNQVLLRELELYEEDISFEVNAILERDFVPGNGGCYVLFGEDTPKRYGSDMEFNRFLSDICERNYPFTPRVNHELLNIQQVSGQYLRARNKVVNALLKGEIDSFQQGTAPECMVYRAAFVRTGIVGCQYERDVGCQKVLGEIDAFFLECIGVRRPFLQLYQRLSGKAYGVRKGVLPLFLAQRIAASEGTPVIYIQRKELGIDGNILNKVNDFPGDYELYIEPESGKKELYLKELERVWQVGEEPGCNQQGRWGKIMEAMQKWYRALPQYARTTSHFPQEDRGKIDSFRNLLKLAEPNPREILFERLPGLWKGDLPGAAEGLAATKMEMEQAFLRLQEHAIKKAQELCGGKQGESLKGSLLSWYRRQHQIEENYILSASAQEFLEFLSHLESNDEWQIVSCLSDIVVGIYMEDWKDDTFPVFCDGLMRICKEVEQKVSAGKGHGQNAIILQDAKGGRLKRIYNADLSDSTSRFFKNMIDEAIEDFGESLETSQKVAVLAEVLREMLTGGDNGKANLS